MQTDQISSVLFQTKTVLFETSMNTTYELMLKSGADVHARNSWDDTPLHFHSNNWNSRLVRTLVSGGADANAVNKVRRGSSFTALDLYTSY